MVVLHKILRELALVFLPSLGDGIRDIFLLKQQVPCIGDVGEDRLDRRILKQAAIDRVNSIVV